MTSWQTFAFNTWTRLTLKPFMRFGSIGALKMLATLSDLPYPSCRNKNGKVKCKSVTGPGYEADELTLLGSKTSRVILSFPGGGFIMRIPSQQRHYIARICEAADANALIVHYRLAPETLFPGGLEDCLAAYHDLLKKGHEPKDITVVGESAGGGLVLSTLLALRDEGTPLPGKAIIVSALADLTHSGKSRKTNEHKDPMLPNVRASSMHELYMGDTVAKDRFLSPIFADFDDLPPMLGIVGSTEILLDDTVRAAKQAKRSGIPFYLDIWKKMPHGFPLFSFLPESKVAIDRMAEFIRNGKLSRLPACYRAG